MIIRSSNKEIYFYDIWWIKILIYHHRWELVKNRVNLTNNKTAILLNLFQLDKCVYSGSLLKLIKLVNVDSGYKVRNIRGNNLWLLYTWHFSIFFPRSKEGLQILVLLQSWSYWLHRSTLSKLISPTKSTYSPHPTRHYQLFLLSGNSLLSHPLSHFLLPFSSHSPTLLSFISMFLLFPLSFAVAPSLASHLSDYTLSRVTSFHGYIFS